MIDKEKRNARQARYYEKNAVELKLRFIRSTDADIIQRLEAVGAGNKQGYIKALIRNDISGSK